MLLSQKAQEKKTAVKSKNQFQGRNDLSDKPVRGKHRPVINVPTAVCVYLIALTGLSIITDGCSVVFQRSCGHRTDVHLRLLMCVHVCEHTA